IPLDPVSMVTYGHADISELQYSNTTKQWEFRTASGLPQRIESTAKTPLSTTTTAGPLSYAVAYPYSDMPASSWLLARRVLRFPANAQGPDASGKWPVGIWPNDTLPTGNPSAWPTAIQFLQGEDDLFQYSFSNANDLYGGFAMPYLGQVFPAGL